MRRRALARLRATMVVASIRMRYEEDSDEFVPPWRGYFFGDDFLLPTALAEVRWCGR